MVLQLKNKLDESREEMEQLQDEVKLFKDAVFVEREQVSPLRNRNDPLSFSSRKSASKLLSDEVLFESFQSFFSFLFPFFYVKLVVHFLFTCSKSFHFKVISSFPAYTLNT